MKANKIKCLAATFLLAVISSNQVKSFCQATTDANSSTVVNEKKDTNPNNEELKSELDACKLEELGCFPVEKGSSFEGCVSNGKNMWAKYRYALNLKPAFCAYKQFAAVREELGDALPDYVEMVSNKKVAKQLKKLIGYSPDITGIFTKEQFQSWYNSANIYARKDIIDKYIDISRYVLQSKDCFLKTKLSPDFTEKLFSNSSFFDVKGRELLRRDMYYNSQLDTLISQAVTYGREIPDYLERCRLGIWGVPFDTDESLDKSGKIDTINFIYKLSVFFESKRESGIFLKFLRSDYGDLIYDGIAFYNDDKTVIEMHKAIFHRLKDGRWLVRYYTPGRGLRLCIFSLSVTPAMIAAANEVHIRENAIEMDSLKIPCLVEGTFIKKDKVKDKSFYTQMDRVNFCPGVGNNPDAELCDYLARVGEDIGYGFFYENDYKNKLEIVSGLTEIVPEVINNFNEYALLDGTDFTRPSNGKPYTVYTLGYPYEELAPLIKKAKAMVAAKDKEREKERERRKREIFIGMSLDRFSQYYKYKVVRQSSSEIVVKRNNTYYYFEATGWLGILCLTQIVNY